MKQLIVGVAYGYSIELLEPFFKSLRRHYQGDCVIVTPQLNEKETAFYEKHNIFTFELEEKIQPKDIQIERYEIYKSILDENFLDSEQILLTDVRDVMFQDDPFKGSKNAELEFFYEPCLFRNCTANWPWMGGVYGKPGMDMVADEWIICGGTIMGKRASVMYYIDTMIEEVNRVRSTGRPLYQGEDQPLCNYLIYSGRFENPVFHHNGEGPITTVHHQQQLTFDRKGRLLNKDGTPTPVVHQWDRADACKSVLEKHAMNG